MQPATHGNDVLIAQLENALLDAERERDLARKRWLDSGTDDMARNIRLAREYEVKVGEVQGIQRSINVLTGGR